MIYIYNRDEEQIDILDIKPKFTREIGKFNTLEFETIKEYEKGYRVVYQYKGKPYEFIIQEQDYLRDDMVSFSYFCKDSFVENEGVPILDKRPQGSYKVALNSVLEDTRWEFIAGSDFSETLTFFNSFYQVSVLEAFAEIVGKYNLEFETSFTFTGSKITSRKIHVKKLGEKANSRLEFGKNIVKFERKILSENIVTALYGYGKGEETETGGYGRRISFADINGGLAYITNEEARLKYGIGPTGSKEHLFGFFIDEEETDKTKLLESTRKELERVSQVQAEYTIEAVNLHIDCDYADTVPVLDEEINFSGETRIVKAIVEGDDLIFIFGHVIKGFTDSFQKEIQKSAEATEIKITSIMETRLNQIADVYFGEDGYNYDLKVGNEYNLPAGLYSFDKPIKENPTKVIYMGAGKMLISNEKDSNGEWIWTTGATGDGIHGESIIAHSITANKLAADVGQSLDLSSNVSITQTVKSETQSYIDENKDQLKGADGNTPYVEDGYWFINGTNTGIKAEGKDGAKGTPGAPGADGKTPYLHIAYANSADGKVGFSVTDSAGKLYIGQYTDYTATDSSDPAKYKWTLIKGENGGNFTWNLIQYTKPINLTKYRGWQHTTLEKISDAEGEYIKVGYTTGDTSMGVMTPVFSITQGTTYTFSAWIKPSVDSDRFDYLYVMSPSKGNVAIPAITGSYPASSWTKVTIKFITPYTSDDAMFMFAKSAKSIPETYFFNIKEIMISEGDNPNQVWSPHPNDLKGTDGLPGKDGVGIKTTIVTYASSTSGTTAPSTGWTSTVPSVAAGNYLWTKTVWTYTDNTTETGYSVSRIGKDGNNGTNGIAGKDGVGIKSTSITYAVSSSGTVPPSSGWVANPPSANPGQYMWTRTVWTYTDNTNETGYSVGKIGNTGATGATGATGPRGATGTSVSSVTEYYLATSASSGISSSNTGFTTAMQPLTATNKYLWNYEKINFSDGTSQPTIPVIIGVYGDKGQTGATGATGRSITGITEYYLATSESSGVTRSTSGWSTTMQKTTPVDKYLWNYEKITWSSGTTTTYVEPIIIGIHGDKGATGDTGPKGADGATPYIGSNGNWWINGIDTGVEADVAPIREEFESYRNQTDKAIEDRVTKTVYNGLTTRVAQAEQKLTPTSITQTVENNTTTLATKAEVQTTAENWTAKFSQIGGKNLLYASNVPVSATSYLITSYDMEEEWQPNTEYTVTIKGTLSGTGTREWGIWASGASTQVATSGAHISGETSFTFTTPSSFSITIPKTLQLYNYPTTGVGPSKVEWIKLEKGSVSTGYDQHPSELYTGITKIDKDGVTVGREGETIETNLGFDGVRIKDGTTEIASFAGSGAVINNLEAESISGDVINIMSNSMTFDIGSETGYYADFSEVLNAIGNRKHLANGVKLTINIRSVLNETISIEGFSGGGSIEVNIYSRVNGYIRTSSNSCAVRVYGKNTTHVVSASGWAVVSSSDAYVLFDGLNIDAKNTTSGRGITSQDGSNVYVHNCDMINCEDALYAGYAGKLHALDTRGNVSRYAAIGYQGSIWLGGTVPDGNNTWFVYTFGNVTRTPSSFSPPATTTVTETRTFNQTDIYTYSVQYGAKSTHYGKAAAQNRWDTSMTQMKGRIVFGSSVYSFISGRNSGTTPTVKMRLRRQNSSHGTSSSVKPTPEWSGAPSFGGATRGNWTPWVTIPYTLFTSSGYTFSFYNGTTGNSYAIWDRAEIQITRTVTQ